MARTPSKILTVAEKKAAETDIKKALKDNAAARKASEALVAEAQKALDAAKKTADAKKAAAMKVVAAAEKEGGKLIAEAQKALDAATKKHTKIFDASNAGDTKLQERLTALAAAPVQKAKPGRKPATEAAPA